MTGEKDIKALMRGMNPRLQLGVFVFCTFPEEQNMPAGLRPLLTFREPEGTTWIIEREDADRAGLFYQFVSRMITLYIHSSLEAVGFMAVIATCLAEAGISVNPVSAFYHDHIFVPYERADDAMRLLQTLSRDMPV